MKSWFSSSVCALTTLATLVANVAAFSADGLVVYDPLVSDFSDNTTSTNITPDIATLISTLRDDLDINLHFKAYTDESLDLFVAGEPLYEHLVLLPSSKKAMHKATFNQHLLMSFINGNGNVLAVGGRDAVLPDDVRLFLNEVGIYPSPKGYRLTDHFNEHLTEDSFVNERILPKINNLSYDGAAALISNSENLFPLVRASATSFTAEDPASAPHISQDKTWTFGQQGYLAVSLQGLNNARLSWVGSSSLILPSLLLWTFQKKNVLKLQFATHHKADEPEFPNTTLYRFKDEVTYTIGVSELIDGNWAPYEVASAEDAIQLSFKMLDPYQRINLTPLGPAALTPDGALDLFVYLTTFTLPDQHGMFTFDLDYKRSGLTFLEDKKIVAVRHLANDEYKRSWDIPNSWVYIASLTLVVAAWLLFVFNFISIGNVDTKKKNA